MTKVEKIYMWIVTNEDTSKQYGCFDDIESAFELAEKINAYVSEITALRIRTYE